MTWPSVLSSPTSTLPTPTPTRRPRPPMITTARLNTSISASADGYSDKNAPPINPPSPASAEPSRKVTRNTRRILTPEASTISAAPTHARVRRAKQKAAEKHTADSAAGSVHHLGVIDSGADQRAEARLIQQLANGSK